MHGSINNIVMQMLFIRIICKKQKKLYVYTYIYIYIYLFIYIYIYIYMIKKCFLDWSELFGENKTSLYYV